ncbi:Hypothetical protein NTJ_04499 [Nesidiocoris tenuis]|uniref:Uncharacterized protein n=1 Tax=Nesidiocoris tenuis TaxID=355587 RepID=A0ABN7AHF7_9HEMI|nr:Hypothetical protein NTJ_04499 [Nesidiocoris tenuis]
MERLATVDGEARHGGRAIFAMGSPFTTAAEPALVSGTVPPPGSPLCHALLPGHWSRRVNPRRVIARPTSTFIPPLHGSRAARLKERARA